MPNFKELGPPDLVHISRYNKQSQKEEGQYHYITGLDVSSAVAPLAYLTTLNLNSSSSSSKHPSIYTYCAYNAFSRCDVRIRTEFPSTSPNSFQLQQIPSDRSNKISTEVSEEVWDELFVSAVVRSVLINLDLERKVPALVEKSLTKSSTHSKNIIYKLVRFIERGPALGCSPLIQRATVVQNFLVDALLKIVELTSLFEYTVELLREIKRKDVNLLIVKVLFLSDREVDAIKLLYQALQKNPRDTLLLSEQVKFLIKKGQFEMALNPALSAVNGSPVDFEAWANLTKLHILNDDIPRALVALNSAPMYGVRPKDLIFIEQKDSISIPFPTEGKIKSVWENSVTQVFGPGSDNLVRFVPRYEVEACDPALIRVNSQELRGTYKAAYDLLILIINRIGWDGLLKARSQVFIMDDEYKNLSALNLETMGDDIKKKRLCERWLDNLFQLLYEDLRVVMIVESELQNERQLKHSGLEWELIGLASYRTHHFKNAVGALRTTLIAKFDIIAAYKLLELWEQDNFNNEFKIWNEANKHGDFDIPLDQLLDTLVKAISYNIRFFNEFELPILLFLKKFLTRYDADFIKNKIQVLFENDNKDYKNAGVIPPFDALVADIQNFSPEYTR